MLSGVRVLSSLHNFWTFLSFGLCPASLTADLMGKEGCKNRAPNVDFVIFTAERNPGKPSLFLVRILTHTASSVPNSTHNPSVDIVSETKHS